MRNFISTMHITGVGIIVFLLFFTTLCMTKAHAQKSKYGSTEWRRNRILNEDSRYTLISTNGEYRYEIYSGEMYGSGSIVMIYDKSGKKLGEWQGKKALGRWVISPKGCYCAVQSNIGKDILIIDKNGKQISYINNRPGSMYFSPSEEELFLDNADTTSMFSISGSMLLQKTNVTAFTYFSDKGNVFGLKMKDGSLAVFTKTGQKIYKINIWEEEKELFPIIKISEEGKVALMRSRKSRELIIVSAEGNINKIKMLNYIPKDIFFKSDGIELIKEDGTKESMGD